MRQSRFICLCCFGWWWHQILSDFGASCPLSRQESICLCARLVPTLRQPLQSDQTLSAQSCYFGISSCSLFAGAVLRLLAMDLAVFDLKLSCASPQRALLLQFPV